MMLSSLLRPSNRPSRGERHPLLFGRGGNDAAREMADSEGESDFHDEDEAASDAAGEDEENRPLLPIFSAAHLGELPLESYAY
jgi:hypothetical protein